MEGKTFIGFTEVMTDARGDVLFAATLSGARVADGHFVTATATSLSTNDTSEFSPEVRRGNR